VLDDRDQHHVLEDVGVAAGMEAVAVAEHRGGW
jgi:imidazoleglycerol phosphate dehydratase HisB